jgi:rSAM/selenodomain-associated transferase 2/rSAM/selenodomain-associated transferase 1
MTDLKTISLVLPVRNEAELIREQLQRLQCYREKGHEVIVIDGGSRDATVEQTKGLVDRCEVSPAGRSNQMNHGASEAKGDILLFLHADTELPINADECVCNALSAQNSRWGWFDVRLSNPRLAYQVVASMMNSRARLTSVSTGDQALFVDRKLFVEIGGFPQLALMEDIAISKVLRRLGRPASPLGLVTTSSRRWEENGLISTILLMWRLRFLYFIGVKPQRLREMYYPSHTEQATAPDVAIAHPRSRIVVLAREPLLGHVKSRLASEIGAQGALAVYQGMLARLGLLLSRGEIATWDLWVTSNCSHKEFLSICNKKNIFLQNGKDLGARMDSAIAQTLLEKNVESVILIGTDCPALTTGYLDQALLALESGVDVVLGPAEDGGYVLVGMRRPIAAVFEDIPWGTDQVMDKTLEALKANGLSYKLLDTLWDVDRPEDLARLQLLEPPLNWKLGP